MKKLLLGCAIILVLGGVMLGVGVYFLYRAATPVIESARTTLDGLAKLGELDREITNQSAYAPPSSGELAAPQVERFVRVQEHVRAALGKRVDEIEAKYDYLKANADTAKQPSFVEVMSSLREMLGLLTDARRAHVDALNREAFSAEEYSWVRTRVYHAAGVEVGGAIDFEKLAQAAREGTGIDSIRVPEAPLAAVPAKNRELVKPHVKRMDEWLPLAFFGL